jgi:hypothetical protein
LLQHLNFIQSIRKNILFWLNSARFNGKQLLQKTWKKRIILESHRKLVYLRSLCIFAVYRHRFIITYHEIKRLLTIVDYRCLNDSQQFHQYISKQNEKYLSHQIV